jgi:hypothetical protein
MARIDNEIAIDRSPEDVWAILGETRRRHAVGPGRLIRPHGGHAPHLRDGGR